jgi:hypothetical protein
MLGPTPVPRLRLLRACDRRKRTSQTGDRRPRPLGFHFAERDLDRSSTRLMTTVTCVLRSVCAPGPQSGPERVANHRDPVDRSMRQDFLVLEPVHNQICDLRPDRLTGLIVQMDHRCDLFCHSLECLSKGCIDCGHLLVLKETNSNTTCRHR